MNKTCATSFANWGVVFVHPFQLQKVPLMKIKPRNLDPDHNCAFDVECARLGIPQDDLAEQVRSDDLKVWVRENRFRRYVPSVYLSQARIVVGERDFQ
jgi:hypothetical protein